MRTARIESRNFKGLQISSLMLGTVQFGLPYGIANKTGQPPYSEVLKILECAYAGGVNCLDTAAVYGGSEEVLGKALAELGLGGEMVVVTKVTHLDGNLSECDASEAIRKSVENSLRLLQLETLPICLFHSEEAYRHVDALLQLQSRGLVQHIGCSVSFPGAAAPILESAAAETLQVPANLLDHRFRHAGMMRSARAQDTAVFVRSVYLQGLLLMPEEDVPPHLQQIVPLRRQLQNLANQAGLTVTELAVRYIQHLEGVTSVVVGVETAGQMQDNIRLFANGPLDTALIEAIEQAVPPLPESILLPANWNA